MYAENIFISICPILFSAIIQNIHPNSFTPNLSDFTPEISGIVLKLGVPFNAMIVL